MTAAERDEARARALDRGGRRIEVMVLVKTTPVPSTKYEDTVCVAGWALSPGPPRWVRLYPIPYRHIDARQQFPKYAVMSVEVGAPHSDPRAESLRVTLDSIRVTQELPADGRDRHREMARIPLTTACSLRDGIRADVNGPSLGLVTPHQLRLETAPHPGRTRHGRSAPDRDGPASRPPRWVRMRLSSDIPRAENRPSHDGQFRCARMHGNAT